jgi:hypothetical protein
MNYNLTNQLGGKPKVRQLGGKPKVHQFGGKRYKTRQYKKKNKKSNTRKRGGGNDTENSGNDTENGDNGTGDDSSNIVSPGDVTVASNAEEIAKMTSEEVKKETTDVLKMDTHPFVDIYATLNSEELRQFNDILPNINGKLNDIYALFFKISKLDSAAIKKYHLKSLEALDYYIDNVNKYIIAVDDLCTDKTKLAALLELEIQKYNDSITVRNPVVDTVNNQSVGGDNDALVTDIPPSDPYSKFKDDSGNYSDVGLRNHIVSVRQDIYRKTTEINKIIIDILFSETEKLQPCTIGKLKHYPYLLDKTKLATRLGLLTAEATCKELSKKNASMRNATKRLGQGLSTAATSVRTGATKAATSVRSGATKAATSVRSGATKVANSVSSGATNLASKMKNPFRRTGGSIKNRKKKLNKKNRSNRTRKH